MLGGGCAAAAGGGGGVRNGGRQQPVRWGGVRAGEGGRGQNAAGVPWPVQRSPAGSPRPSPRPGAPPPPTRAASSRRGAAIPMGTACLLRCPEYFQPSSLPTALASPRRSASHLHAPYVRQDVMESGDGGVSAHTCIYMHTHSIPPQPLLGRCRYLLSRHAIHSPEDEEWEA